MRRTIPALLSFLFGSTVLAGNFRLDPIWTIPAGGGYITTAGNQRGMAYNRVTGHVLLVDKSLVTIYIFDGATGDFIGTMDTTATITAGTSGFKLTLIRVGDDGAVYVANLSNSTTNPQFVLYRWATETSAQTIVYGAPSGGNPSPGFGNQRWGDTLAVRGAGINTMVLAGTRGVIAGIFRPSDGTMAAFTNTVATLDAPAGATGYGVAFGPGNTFWATAGATSQVTPPPGNPMRLFSFNLNQVASATVTNTVLLRSFPTPPLAPGLAPIMVDPTLNLLAATVIDPAQASHSINLYDITDLNSTPVLYDSKPTAGNPNTIFAGPLDFAHADGFYGGNRLFALDCNNGVYAFALNTTADAAPAIVGQPVDTTNTVGTIAALYAAVGGSTPMRYQWYRGGDTPVANATNSILLISNVQFSAAGSYSLRVTNSAGNITSASATLTIAGTPPPLEVHAYEDFSYPAGDLLEGHSPANDQVWDGFGGTMADDGLLYSGLASSSGRSVVLTGGASEQMTLSTNTLNRGSFFYSFLLRVDGLPGTPGASSSLAAFANSAANNQQAQLSLRVDAGGEGYNLGITKVTALPVWDSAIHKAGETVFVVVRYSFNDGGSLDDFASLWINPSPVTFGAVSAPPPTVSGQLLYPDITLIDKIVLRQSVTISDPITIDELRVDTSWAAVTPAGPAAGPSLNVSVAGDTATLSWPRSFDGYILQSTASLGSPLAWNNIPEPVVQSGTNNTVTVTGASSGAQFFRLQK